MQTTESITCVIIDDEQQNRENLSGLLALYCPEVKVIGEYDHAAAAHQALMQESPDVVFLDINMPEIDGFQFLELFANRQFQVIFVTAHPQHALQAIKAQAADYLLKPISIPELRQAVGRVLEKQQQQTPPPLPGGGTPVPVHVPSERLTLPSRHGFLVVETNRLLYLQADNTYTTVFRHEDEPVLVSKPLRDFERLLNPDHFVRIHKSAIIHLAWLKEYSHLDGGYVVMSDGAQLSISRRKLQAFQDKMKQYSISLARNEQA